MKEEQQKALDKLAKEYAASLGPLPTEEELKLLKKLKSKKKKTKDKTE